MTTSFDAIVVGSGPNGLAAALRIAEAGHRVLVLEAADTVGGGCRSAELTLPGFTHDVCAAVHALGADAEPFSAAHLGEHAPRWSYADIPLAHPLDGGRAALQHRSIDDTARGLGVDGDAWRRMMQPLVDDWTTLRPELMQPVVHVPRHPLALARFGVHAVRPATWTAGRFRTEAAAALFGGSAAHAMLPLHRPLTTAFGLLLGAGVHASGWPVATGGSQRVVDGLAARILELGGEVRTGERVDSMAQLPPHRVVLFDTGPGQVADIAGDALPSNYRTRLRRFRHGPGAFKIDYALDGPVPWTNPDCRRAGTLHLVGSFDELARAEAEVAAGRMPERPFVLAVQASVFDHSRAPEGRHTLWAYAHVPHGHTGDATGAIEAQLERFAPGFRDRVLARHVRTPADLQLDNANYVGGDISGGAHSGWQLVFRPTVGLHPYMTPNPSILMCSASTPPGAGVHGMCGWNAAGRALEGPLRH